MYLRIFFLLEYRKKKLKETNHKLGEKIKNGRKFIKSV